MSMPYLDKGGGLLSALTKAANGSCILKPVVTVLIVQRINVTKFTIWCRKLSHILSPVKICFLVSSSAYTRMKTSPGSASNRMG